jgi:hypothetical protein
MMMMMMMVVVMVMMAMMMMVVMMMVMMMMINEHMEVVTACANTGYKICKRKIQLKLSWRTEEGENNRRSKEQTRICKRSQTSLVKQKAKNSHKKHTDFLHKENISVNLRSNKFD